MKTVFRFWSRTENNVLGNTPDFREPTLSRRDQCTVSPSIPTRLKARPSDFSHPAQVRPHATPQADLRAAVSTPALLSIPVGNESPVRSVSGSASLMESGERDAYALQMERLRELVAARPSAFNTLEEAAKKLTDFIPSEIDRLQAAWAMQRGEWTPESLSVAIQHHIADIEEARLRAREAEHRVRPMRESALARLQSLKDAEERVEQQIRTLLAERARIRQDREKAQQELQTFADAVVNAPFINQAAENLIRDLLAKKAILGLP